MAGSGDQIKNLFKWRHLFAKFATNSSCATEINLELFWLEDLLRIWSQYPGSVVPLAMFDKGEEKQGKNQLCNNVVTLVTATTEHGGSKT